MGGLCVDAEGGSECRPGDVAFACVGYCCRVWGVRAGANRVLGDLRYGQGPVLLAPGQLSIVGIVGVSAQKCGDGLLGIDVGNGEPIEQYSGRLLTSGGQCSLSYRIARCVEFGTAHVHAASVSGIADDIRC